jgi:hypothetical protein
MMDYNCNEERIFPYRVVQTLYERNTMPCPERLNGMIVTVVGNDKDYKQYMLKGGDPCVNANWVDYQSPETYASFFGHETLTEPITGPIEDSFLNARYPSAREGFRVSIPSLNATFMKIFNNAWVSTNNTELNDE